MKKTLIYILAILLSFGCSSRNKKPPEKPKDVPHVAKWYGGEDGGAWYIVKKSDTKNHFNLEIYNDYNGSIWAKGEFMLNSECNTDKTYSVREIEHSINAWTGETVILSFQDDNKLNCSLVPLTDQSND